MSKPGKLISLLFHCGRVFITVTAILLAVYALRGVYPFGSGSVLALDLNGQYVYYYEAFRDLFTGTKSLFYSYSRSLGGEMMGVYAYYLASPFTFIILLFPKNLISEAVLAMIILKVGLAGAAFAIYLRSTWRAPGLPLFIFSLSYALCSYSVVQTLNPMWLDGLIFFPLAALGIERLILQGKPALYIFFLALLITANFYIGYMSCYFLFVYFIYAPHRSSLAMPGRCFLKKLGLFTGSSLLAVGLSAWLLMPVYFALKLGKFSFSEPVFMPFQRLDIIDLFSKLLPLSYDSVNITGFPFIYSGMVTLLLLALFFTPLCRASGEKKAALAIFAFFLIIFSVSTPDIILHGFQEPVWLNYRYSFIFSFFALVFAYRAYMTIEIEKPDLLIKTVLLIHLALIMIGRSGYHYIESEKTLWLSHLLINTYGVFLYTLKKAKGDEQITMPRSRGESFNYRNIAAMMFVLVVVLEFFLNTSALIEGAHREVYYSNRDSYRGYVDPLYSPLAYIKSNDDGFFRTETLKRRSVNDPMALDIYGLSHSSSIFHKPTIDLFNQLGFSAREHWTSYKGATPVTESLLGVRYIVVENSPEQEYFLGSETLVSDARAVRKEILQNCEDLLPVRGIPSFYDPFYSEKGFTVYQNPYAMPLIFKTGCQIATLELSSYDPFINQNNLLNSLAGITGVEFFKLININNITFENMAGYSHQGLVLYNAIDPGKNAHIEYVLETAGDNEMFLYLLSDHPRQVNVWLENEYLDTYFAHDSFCILPLGSHPDREQISLITTPIEEEYYLNHNMFYYLDSELYKKAFTNLLQTSPVGLEKRSENALTIILEAAEKELLFTTIPYDPAWRVMINGRRVEATVVLDSLLAVNLEPGYQHIELLYIPRGFYPGLTMTMISLIFFGLILNREVILYRKEKAYANQ